MCEIERWRTINLSRKRWEDHRPASGTGNVRNVHGSTNLSPAKTMHGSELERDVVALRQAVLEAQLHVQEQDCRCSGDGDAVKEADGLDEVIHGVPRFVWRVAAIPRSISSDLHDFDFFSRRPGCRL